MILPVCITLYCAFCTLLIVLIIFLSHCHSASGLSLKCFMVSGALWVVFEMHNIHQASNRLIISYMHPFLPVDHIWCYLCQSSDTPLVSFPISELPITPILFKCFLLRTLNTTWWRPWAEMRYNKFNNEVDNLQVLLETWSFQFDFPHLCTLTMGEGVPGIPTFT